MFINENEIDFEKEKEKLLETSIIEIVNKKKDDEKKAREENEALMIKIKQNLKKMPELLEKHYTQVAKQSLVSEEKLDKMNLLMEEARDRFGYYPHRQDPKFVKLIEEFNEQKKLERKKNKNKRV
ncbi:unnamed protein product [Heterobilharzia americana]|nr:unnamed protein product [Heterobilharzia americana]